MGWHFLFVLQIILRLCFCTFFIKAWLPLKTQYFVVCFCFVFCVVLPINYRADTFVSFFFQLLRLSNGGSLGFMLLPRSISVCPTSPATLLLTKGVISIVLTINVRLPRIDFLFLTVQATVMSSFWWSISADLLGIVHDWSRFFGLRTFTQNHSLVVSVASCMIQIFDLVRSISSCNLSSYCDLQILFLMLLGWRKISLTHFFWIMVWHLCMTAVWR